MYFRRIKRGNSFRLKTMGLAIVFGATLFTPRAIRASEEKKPNSNGNVFYMQVLNYAMPFVKVTSFDEEIMKEATFTVKDALLSFCGLNLRNPGGILKKELPALAMANEGPEGKEESGGFIFNPFKLDDNLVSREAPQEKAEPVKDDLNLKSQAVNVYEPKLKKQINKAKPEVFIYHTHTSEAYEKRDSNDKSNNTVVGVGDLVKQELENNYGISVVHDATIHDVKDYNGAYGKSRETVKKYLSQYGDFKVMIDLHRDSVSREKVTTRMNDENVSRIMFVMPTKNPHYDKNMKMVNSMMDTANKLFPGYCRGVYSEYKYGIKFYSQDLSNNACLIEVGTDTSYSDEAKASAKYLARVIAEYVNGKN